MIVLPTLHPPPMGSCKFYENWILSPECISFFLLFFFFSGSSISVRELCSNHRSQFPHRFTFFPLPSPHRKILIFQTLFRVWLTSLRRLVTYEFHRPLCTQHAHACTLCTWAHLLIYSNLFHLFSLMTHYLPCFVSLSPALETRSPNDFVPWIYRIRINNFPSKNVHVNIHGSIGMDRYTYIFLFRFVYFFFSLSL